METDLMTCIYFFQVQKQSMLSNSAHDSQALWEEELKSRSKLGLRLAELEKEKGELGSHVSVIMTCLFVYWT